MKALPRSEKIYAYIVVAAMVVIVIWSVIRAFHSNNKDRPAYESAPPPALVPPADEPIADPTIAAQAPIDDKTFEVLHRTTRLIAPRLTSPDWRDELRPLIADPGVLADLEHPLASLRTIAHGATPDRARSIEVIRPVDGKTRTATYIGLLRNGPETSGSSGYAATFFWELRDGTWKLYGIDVRANATPGESSSDGAAGKRAAEIGKARREQELLDEAGVDTQDAEAAGAAGP